MWRMRKDDGHEPTRILEGRQPASTQLVAGEGLDTLDKQWAAHPQWERLALALINVDVERIGATEA